MAAAAYASLVSLLNTIDQIQIHHLLSTCFHNHQNRSLSEKVGFFIDFLENYSDTDVKTEDMLRRIAVAARVAEDTIEVHSAHRIRATTSSQQSPSFLPDLQLIIQEMDSIKAEVETGFITRHPTYPSSATPIPTPATTKTTPMVGFDGYVKHLSDQLTGHHSGREILPIVGMGGIGKTTLTRYVYESSVMLRTFNLRAWVTVSQVFSSRDILLQALSCLGVSTSSMDTDQQLGLKLYQYLYGRRYLIVLDDMWTEEAWEKIMFYFPENKKGSRIVVTTRVAKLVSYFGSSSLVVDFLDDKNSWELFCLNCFGQQGCPPELEEVGKKIVGKCRGLPLSIVVIGGLLGKSARALKFWEMIMRDKSVILDSGDGNKPLSILYLSYKHLPIWLKPCFLYLGLFPEDYGIEVSQLITLWVAEGFIKPNANQSLEEVTQTYIKDLFDRNLLLVGRRLSVIQSCRVHDLVRDLCIKISEEENFFRIQRDIDGTRHYICDQTAATLYPRTSETPSLVRPQTAEHEEKTAPSKSRLLRVLFSNQIMEHGGEVLDYNFRQVNLRFLFHSPRRPMHHCEIPTSISLLWNLQTLIIMGSVRAVAPPEVWEMPHLRHIKITSIRLPEPPPTPSEDGHFVILKNLQTLRKVKNLVWSEEVCKRMPNLKELGVEYDSHEESKEPRYMPGAQCWLFKQA